MHKGFKCLDISSGRVYISRDVVFDENTFPFSTLHPNAGARLCAEILLLPPELLNPTDQGDNSVDHMINGATNPDHDAAGNSEKKLAQNDTPSHDFMQHMSPRPTGTEHEGDSAAAADPERSGGAGSRAPAAAGADSLSPRALAGAILSGGVSASTTCRVGSGAGASPSAAASPRNDGPGGWAHRHVSPARFPVRTHDPTPDRAAAEADPPSLSPGRARDPTPDRS